MMFSLISLFFFFSSRRRHTRLQGDWSSDVCSSDLRYPNLILVHGPIHASWLNQIEIYFSIVQRKILTPNDFRSLQQLAQRLLAFERHYQTVAKPFEWRLTRKKLHPFVSQINRPLAKAAYAIPRP